MQYLLMIYSIEAEYAKMDPTTRQKVIYQLGGPAANLLVAARSLGLGAAFTFSHMLAGPALPQLLGLPGDVAIAVTIPVGWPVDPAGPVRRRCRPSGVDATGAVG